MFEFDVANATNVWVRNLREPLEGRPSERLKGRPLTAAEKERVNARYRASRTGVHDEPSNN